MSKIIATAAIRGAHKIVSRAEEQLGLALQEIGADAPVKLPDTAYYLPVIYAMLGVKVKKVGDMQEVVQQARALLKPVPTDNLWLPYLGDALDAGMATLFAQEVIEGLKYARHPHPYEGVWLGATSDAILREQGIKLVDGRMPGFAACVGALPTTEAAVKLARDLQERNILVFMASHTNGTSMAEQLAEMHEGNRRLSEQMLTLQEHERRDLARDLHDEVSPFLFAINVALLIAFSFNLPYFTGFFTV